METLRDRCGSTSPHSARAISPPATRDNLIHEVLVIRPVVGVWRERL